MALSRHLVKSTIAAVIYLLGKRTLNLTGTEGAGNSPAHLPEMGMGGTFQLIINVSAALHVFPARYILNSSSL